MSEKQAAVDGSTIEAEAPERLMGAEGIRFGRYREPILDPRLALRPWERFRLKEWHYSSVTTDRVFVAFGLVSLGYMANAFLYLVDRRRPEQLLEYEALSPLGLGMRFAPSSIAGRTSFRKGRDRLEISYDECWLVRIDLHLPGGHLRGSFRIEPRESLALVHPLGDRRAAYTHKAAGLPVSGLLQLDTERYELEGALGVLDWTRSLADRETRWKWASSATRLESGESFGLNLSAEVYDDEAGDSRENAFWLGGKVRALGGVRFELPRNPGCEDWSIRSREGEEVALRFRPLGARSQQVNLRLVRSDFVQPYGLFDGYVAGHRLDAAFGVVEDHLALW